MLLLRASVIWTAWVWIVLIRNMIDSTDAWSFRLIHIGLGVVSLAFAVVTWVITSKARRFTRSVERERRPNAERSSMAQRAGASARRRSRPSTAVPLPEVSIPISGSLPVEAPD
jgi:hypothetical protein